MMKLHETSSPSSVTKVASSPQAAKSSDVIQYLESLIDSKITVDDPTLVIIWDDAVIEDLILQIHGDFIVIPIPLPAYLNIASPRYTMFSYSCLFVVSCVMYNSAISSQVSRIFYAW